MNNYNECIKAQIKNLEYEIDELQKQINEKEQLLEDFKRKNWPQKNDEIYIVYGNGDIGKRIYLCNDIYSGILKQGNMFRTKEEAEKEIEKREILTELKKYTSKSGEYVITIEEGIDIHRIDALRDFDVVEHGRRLAGTLYFDSIEIAKDAISIIGEENILKLFY